MTLPHDIFKHDGRISGNSRAERPRNLSPSSTMSLRLAYLSSAAVADSILTVTEQDSIVFIYSPVQSFRLKLRTMAALVR